MKSDALGTFDVLPATSEAPFFSFLLSVKNGLPDLKVALASIEAQTFTDWELVLVNDGSDPETSAFLREFQGQEKRCTLVIQENMGLTRSLVRGAALCRGQYIVRQDADDESDSRRLAELHSVILEKSPDVLASRAQRWRDGRPDRIVPGLALITGISFDSLRFGNVFVHGSLCIKREHLLKNNYDIRWAFAQDYDLFIRLLRSPLKIAYLKRPLYVLHENGASLSRSQSVRQLDCAKSICLHHFGDTRFLLAGKGSVEKAFLHLARYLQGFLNVLTGKRRIDVI